MRHDADRAKVILGGAMRVCCPEWNQPTTDDGDLIYPDICECICHTEELNEHE